MRLSVKDLQALIVRINKRLDALDSVRHLEYEGRNNYHAVDVYIGKGCETNATTGPVKLVYNWLSGYNNALRTVMDLKGIIQ